MYQPPRIVHHKVVKGITARGRTTCGGRTMSEFRHLRGEGWTVDSRYVTCQDCRDALARQIWEAR